MIFPSLDRVKAIAPGYDIVPVYMEILSDVRTPISVLKALKQVSSHTYLLESADNSNHWGRYSFLGYDPKIELFCKNHKMTIKDGTTRTFECSDPAAEIRNILSQYKSPRLEELPTFTGGFVGYFACEYIRYIEPTLDFPTPDDDSAMVNDVDLMLFDKVIAFDHFRQKIVLIVNIRTGEPVITHVTGGVSGPAVLPVGLAAVWRVRAALPEIPIIGIGGIDSGETALEYLYAGANAVEVGAAALFEPTAPLRVARELDDLLDARPELADKLAKGETWR